MILQELSWDLRVQSYALNWNDNNLLYKYCHYNLSLRIENAISKKSDGLYDPRHYETAYQRRLKNPVKELLKFQRIRGALYNMDVSEDVKSRIDSTKNTELDYFSKRGLNSGRSYNRKTREDQPPPFLYPRYGR